uniref:Uncharacterized protein n=1 Tax=Cacopsylla melanoneura TaxID=428564 RepID=A0A8D9E582_9HEMI
MASRNVFLLALFVLSIVSLNNALDPKSKDITFPDVCKNCKGITMDFVKDVCGESISISIGERSNGSKVVNIIYFREVTEAKCNAAGTCHLEIKMSSASHHGGMDCNQKVGPAAGCTCTPYEN